MLGESDTSKKIEEITECPECESKRIVQDYHRGELVCQNCGLVVDESFIDQGPEWRAFNAEERDAKARTGPPTDYRGGKDTISTTIRGTRDSFGRSIPTKNRSQLYRLKKWHRRIGGKSTVQSKLASALKRMDQLSSGLGLPRSARETAALIYKKAIEEDFIKGRKIDAVAAAAVYAACRQSGIPRTLDDVVEASTVDRKEIGRTYRLLARELSLNLMPASPQDYVDYFGSQLDLSQAAKTKALDILQQAEEKGLTSGRGPTGVAAAAIYIASILCGEHRTQQQVADVAGVTEVTIRNRYKELPETPDDLKALLQ